MFLVATDLGFMHIKGDTPLDALRWLRETFGFGLKVSWLMEIAA